MKDITDLKDEVNKIRGFSNGLLDLTANIDGIANTELKAYEFTRSYSFMWACLSSVVDLSNELFNDLEQIELSEMQKNTLADADNDN